MKNVFVAIFGSMKATQARGTIRKALKAHIGIAWGKSNPALERTTTSCARTVLGLPRGPEETTQSWCASARLGVYICTVVLWISTCRPRVLFFCSRVKEKGASYSCSIFKALSDKHIDWSRAHSLVVWSDGGKHFRCNATISTITLRGLEAFGM